MSLVYKPRGRAREYAELACNVYRGCGHRCIYCYAPNATYMSKAEFEQPQVRKNFLSKLEHELVKSPGQGQQILLSFTCDPYQPFDVEQQATRHTIKLLHEHGYNVQILTKGGTRALRDLDLFRPTDAFATTLTLLSDHHSAIWEPEAALPQDRIDTIREFHQAGIPTWVSLEPVLNPDSALELIRCTYQFVNLFKVGILNYHPLAQQIDWRKFADDVVELLESLDCQYYLKKDLTRYLAQ